MKIELILEIIKIIVSGLTPIILLIFGVIINRNLERRIKDLMQEKEWKNRWADLFFNKAISFGEKISLNKMNIEDIIIRIIKTAN